MNRRELQWDQPIHVPLLRVLSFPPLDGISALARQRAPHLATTRKDNTSCNILFMFCAAARIQRQLVIARTAIASIKLFKRRPVCEAVQIAVRHEVRALCGGVISCIVVGSTVQAAELASFVYAGAIVYDMTRVHACSDHTSVCCTVLPD